MYRIARATISEKLKLKLTDTPLAVLGFIIISLMLFLSLFSQNILSGQSFGATFNETGTFEYHDDLYKHIRGEVIVVQSTSNNDFLTYEDPVAGIRIWYPSNWEKIEQQGGKLNVIFKSPQENSSDSFQENLEISIANLASTNMSLNELTTAHIGTLKGSAPTLQIWQSSNTTLAGNPAYTVVYTNESRFEGMEAWTVKGDKAYLIRYVAEAPNYSNYLPVIQQMLASFEIISSESEGSQENSQPEAHDMIIQKNDTSAVAFELNGTDADTGDKLTFVITLNPQVGLISQFDSSTGFIVYTPRSNFSNVGADFFRYMVTDNTGAKSKNATVSIQYCPVADC
jgi:PsbP-like protein